MKKCLFNTNGSWDPELFTKEQGRVSPVKALRLMGLDPNEFDFSYFGNRNIHADERHVVIEGNFPQDFNERISAFFLNGGTEILEEGEFREETGDISNIYFPSPHCERGEVSISHFHHIVRHQVSGQK